MGPSAAEVQLNDFVGDHGSYQLTITLFAFVKYIFFGLMSNSGPLMTPDVTFYCQLPADELEAIMPNITLLNATERDLEIKEEFKRICQIDLHLYQQTYLNVSETNRSQAHPGFSRNSNGTFNRIRECNEFSYEIAQDQGRTMTSEFGLVCDNEGLRSVFQSIISAAIVVAHVFWGTFSDKFGRFQAQKLCFLISLIAGSLSIVATDFWSFVIFRALCSFGDLGQVVSMTTTVVETVGNQYRGLSVATVSFGSALGVSLLPYIVAYFEDFRKVIIFTVLCQISSIPFLLVSNESIRWLLTNRRFQLAKREMRRIMYWNHRWRALCDLLLWWRHRKSASSMPTSRQDQRMDTKLKFDLLYNKFIEQIESQNFCDPAMSSNFAGEFSSPQPSDVSFTEYDFTTQVDIQHLDEEQHNGASRVDQQSASNECRPAPPEAIQHQSEEHEQLMQPAVHDSQPPPMTRAAVVPKGLSISICRLDSLEQAATNGVAHLLLANKAGSCSQLESLESARKQQQEATERRKREEQSDAFGVMHNHRQHGHRHHHHHARNHPDCINLVAHQLSFMGRVSRLFKDKQLMIAVFTIVWTTFNSELQYTSFIIINLEVGEDVYLNYILGGCMEAIAAVLASALLSYASRRHTLITFWLLISLSCFGLSVAHIDSTWAVWLLALAKFSQSCLSSVVSVAAYESFPTFLRQSGSGLVSTLGMTGSVFAPLIFAEFDDQAGMDRVLMTFSLSSLSAAFLIYRYLRETKNCDLQ